MAAKPKTTPRQTDTLPHALLKQRGSGVLLHVSSLPGAEGIGDLGAGARTLIDHLYAAKQTYWQVLPLGPTGFADSPYQCLSTFAGNTNLISLGDLAAKGWLPPDYDVDRPFFPQREAVYESVIAWHDKMLARAYDGFLQKNDRDEKSDFERFRQEQAEWLDDFALFAAIKETHQLRPWWEWPQGEALRAPEEIAGARQALKSRIDEMRFRQWVFARQWQALKGYANQRGIAIIGDIPIYVAHDSSDVWTHRALFDLDENGYAVNIAGVPPDYFSATGQRWGNPLYLWKRHQKEGFAWWKKRIEAALTQFDLVRIDHFRGFWNYWSVPASQATAANGQWLDGPKDVFFKALRDEVKARIIAEDLGDAMGAIVDWRKTKLHLPGMKVLQFLFGGSEEEQKQFATYPHDPQAADDFSVMYTGTHDNNTALGWWHSDAQPFEQERLQKMAHTWQIGAQAAQQPNWAMIELASRSNSVAFLTPLQDLLNLGATARMNTPGKGGGNWRWRCTLRELNDEQMWRRLRALTESCARA
ncbi:MAG: 4-alpha-glucanotransferase [Chloroflexi bacterium]|nr:4-alpha-glucanotransferase [Chloroflexota bacterium]